MLSPLTIVVWAVSTLVVGVGVAAWLVLAYTDGDPDTSRVRLDAIRTAGTLVVGTGGAAALLLAARRQRTAEIALRQKDRDQADVARAHALQVHLAEQTRQHQERVAAATESDAASRRITDLYTKAGDQLGAERAPVRLAGLYALERLAQDHVEQRQTIVNVLCAYLRMPFTVPGEPPADDADADLITAHRERVQEREVRRTAQRVLAHHLRAGDDPTTQVHTFWAGIDLDLTGATLVDLDLRNSTVRDADFGGATFVGDAEFSGAAFTGAASFRGAGFTGTAWFYRAEFTGTAWFEGSGFAGDAWFGEATFTAAARFGGAGFAAAVGFSGATFTGPAGFVATRFGDAATFGRATFTAAAAFGGARFARKVPPEVARFVVASPDWPTGDSRPDHRGPGPVGS